MRLDKFISHCTPLSRKQSRIEIHAGRVRVNGMAITTAAANVQSSDAVTLAETVLTLPGPRYLMLNKPINMVCATTDPSHPCVIDLLNDQAPGLKIAGRLDKDSTGLVLLSDDGDWIHKVTSPRRSCAKTYRVEIDTPLTDTTIERFAQGILLHSEAKPTRPAVVESLSEYTTKVMIEEGRYHQIKRMFAACGHHVTRLHREQIGAIRLDEKLLAGQYRPLFTAEIASVLAQ